MIKILTICTVEFGRNGITSHIKNYFKELNKSKFQMDFIVINHLPPDIKADLIQIDKSTLIFELPMRNCNQFKYLIQLCKIIRKNKYDIIHAHGNSCTLAVEMLGGWLGGCRVRIAHSHNTSCSHLKMHKLLRPLFELTCSERFACGKKAGKWLFHNKEFYTITNGIPIMDYAFSEYDRNVFRTELGLTHEKVIGHVGLFNDQKNHEFVIDVFDICKKRNGSLKLLLVGMGEKENYIRKIVHERQLEDSVVFYGESDDVPKCMWAMDLFFFPSKYEGLGMALIEAQLSGLPCVSANTVPKITKIGDRIHYLKLSTAPENWADLILDLLEKDYTRSNFIQKNLKRVEEYNIKINANKLDKLYIDMGR